MATYTVWMVKRANNLNLSSAGEVEAHVIALANGIRPRRIRDVPAHEYLDMKREYQRASLPNYYRLEEGGADRWQVFSCACDCECGDCGLQVQCVDCECEGDDHRPLGSFPRELTGGHLIDAGDDPVKLTELLLGVDCAQMPLSDFRTLQMAIMMKLQTGEVPLSESGTPPT